MNGVDIVAADLARPDHAAAVLEMIDAYSRDAMGSGEPLADEVRAALIDGLRAHPTTLVFLAYVETRPVGIAVCFRGFSTFRAKSLVNVHDLAVLPELRGRGVGRQLLAAVEARARALGCCKLTLEVLERNHRARAVYRAAGFACAGTELEADPVLFLAKPLV